MHVHTGKLQSCYRDQISKVPKSSSSWTQLSLCGKKPGAGELQMNGKARFFPTSGGPSSVKPFQTMADNCGTLFGNKNKGKCSLVVIGPGSESDAKGFYVVVFRFPSYSEQFIV